MSRPISPKSDRQLKPWVCARVSRTTWYKALSILKAATMPEDTIIHPWRVVDFANVLAAMSRESGVGVAEVYSRCYQGQDLATPPTVYITERELVEMDKAKSKRLRGRIRTITPNLGPLLHVEHGKVMGNGPTLSIGDSISVYPSSSQGVQQHGSDCNPTLPACSPTVEQ